MNKQRTRSHSIDRTALLVAIAIFPLIQSNYNFYNTIAYLDSKLCDISLRALNLNQFPYEIAGAVNVLLMADMNVVIVL